MVCVSNEKDGIAMKITGTSSYIEVELDGKVVKIEGEMLVGGFVAYKDTMKYWEPPHDHELIKEEVKKSIVAGVIDKTKNSHFVIEFE